MLNESERFDLEVLRAAVSYRHWILDAFGPAVRGRVLEVGAGLGSFTAMLSDLADRLTALEPDPNLRAVLETTASFGVEVRGESIEELPVADAFDAVVLINVLEHIVDDAGALSAVATHLAPGGSVCILVPAHPALYGSLDAKYEHIRRYGANDLRDLLANAGFAHAWVRHFNPLGAIGWFVAGRVVRVRRITPMSIKLTERVVVPAGRRLERAWRPAFGQSLVAVAVRE